MRQWLQLSTAAAGIGIALAAAPAAAHADDGTASSPSSASAGSARQHAAKAARSPQRAQNARKVPAASAQTVRRTEKAPAATASARQAAAPATLRTASVKAVLPAPTALAASPIGDGLRVILNSAATWLAGLPANPITDALQGAVWSIRRTLFPATVGVVTAPIKIPLTQVPFCFSGAKPDGSCSLSLLPCRCPAQSC